MTELAIVLEDRVEIHIMSEEKITHFSDFSKRDFEITDNWIYVRDLDGYFTGYHVDCVKEMKLSFNDKFNK